MRFLAAQHMMLLLIIDGRFAHWRIVMFLPVAMLVGYAAGRRPSLLPYLVVVRAIIDIGIRIAAAGGRLRGAMSQR
mgnify:CR=1 FL=1